MLDECPTHHAIMHIGCMYRTRTSKITAMCYGSVTCRGGDKNNRIRFPHGAMSFRCHKPPLLSYLSPLYLLQMFRLRCERIAGYFFCGPDPRYRIRFLL